MPRPSGHIIELIECRVNNEVVYDKWLMNALLNSGIEEVPASSATAPTDAVYDVMGRRVKPGQMIPGSIYIRDGRKFVCRQ